MGILLVLSSIFYLLFSSNILEMKLFPLTLVINDSSNTKYSVSGNYGYVYNNYTLGTNNKTTSVLQVRHGTGVSYNITGAGIPVGCWDTIFQVRFQSYDEYDSTLPQWSRVQCYNYNGTEWESIGTLDNGTSKSY